MISWACIAPRSPESFPPAIFVREVRIHKRRLDFERRLIVHPVGTNDVSDLETDQTDLTNTSQLIPKLIFLGPRLVAKLVVNVREDAVPAALSDVEGLTVVRGSINR